MFCDNLLVKSNSPHSINVGDVCFCEFRHLVLRAALENIFLSPFGHAIFLIVGRCSQKKMIWINAFSVVARMANHKIAGLFFIEKKPRYSVNEKWNVVYEKLRVCVNWVISNPFPAILFLKDINFIPKLFNSFVCEVWYHFVHGIIMPYKKRVVNAL